MDQPNETIAKFDLFLEAKAKALSSYAQKPNPKAAYISHVNDEIQQLVNIRNECAKAGDLTMWSYINEEISRIKEIDTSVAGYTIQLSRDEDFDLSKFAVIRLKNTHL